MAKQPSSGKLFRNGEDENKEKYWKRKRYRKESNWVIVTRTLDINMRDEEWGNVLAWAVAWATQHEIPDFDLFIDWMVGFTSGIHTASMMRMKDFIEDNVSPEDFDRWKPLWKALVQHLRRRQPIDKVADAAAKEEEAEDEHSDG